MADIVVPIIFLVAVIPIAIALIIYLGKFIKLFHSTSIGNTSKDLENITTNFQTKAIDINNITYIPNVSFKEIKRYSNSTQIIIKSEENNIPIIGISNIETFGFAIWNIASAIGYIGNLKFEFQKNRLGTKFYLDGKYVGYKPNRFYFYSYGKFLDFRDKLKDEFGNQLIKFNRTKIESSTSMTGVINNMSEDIASPLIPSHEFQYNSTLSLTRVSDNKEIAYLKLGADLSNKKLSIELVKVDTTLDAKYNTLIVLYYLASHLGL